MKKNRLKKILKPKEHVLLPLDTFVDRLFACPVAQLAATQMKKEGRSELVQYPNKNLYTINLNTGKDILEFLTRMGKIKSLADKKGIKI